MGRKFKVWLDSGANIHSCRKQIIDLDDIGVDSDEWDEMSDRQKEECMRDIAFDRLDWGFTEIEGGES
ncbi:hypothetical protein [Comamonas odontotermitis]|uniref:DUF7167 family protein n=1 Tax=Comamonas odontotermitis TaxID=379895 RepID=UPI0037513093